MGDRNRAGQCKSIGSRGIEVWNSISSLMELRRLCKSSGTEQLPSPNCRRARSKLGAHCSIGCKPANDSFDSFGDAPKCPRNVTTILTFATRTNSGFAYMCGSWIMILKTGPWRPQSGAFIDRNTGELSVDVARLTILDTV